MLNYEMIKEELKDNLFYQAIFKSGFEKGYKESLEKSIKDTRKILVIFCEKRFPATLAWAREQLEQINDRQTLLEIASRLFAAYTEDEVRLAFASSQN